MLISVRVANIIEIYNDEGKHLEYPLNEESCICDDIDNSINYFLKENNIDEKDVVISVEYY